ncbi:MAG: hypothetical protein JOY69_08665 [Candidatus Eremiobacteraeota bacterium]|nr:hypothetical protein [Candidatus Eremiobacteraeota bacterium]
MIRMLRERSLTGTNNVIIWGASGLLALVLGVGIAFSLWLGLHRVDQALVAQAAVGSLSLGLVLIGVGAQRPMTRVFFVLLAATLVLGYALGGAEFARLAV